MRNHILIFFTMLIFSTAVHSSNNQCEFIFAGATSFSSQAEALKVFKLLSQRGIGFYVRGEKAYPFQNLPPGMRVVIREIVHHRARTQLHLGSLLSTGADFVVIEINGQSRRIDLENISGYSLLSETDSRSEQSSNVFESMRDSWALFLRWAEGGITMTEYSYGFRFPFEKFQLGSEFLLLEKAGSQTKIHRGALLAWDTQSVTLKVGKDEVPILLSDVMGVTLKEGR